MSNRIVTTYRAWRKYRQTYNELMRLSNRDLADLGISACGHPGDRPQGRHVVIEFASGILLPPPKRYGSRCGVLPRDRSLRETPADIPPRRAFFIFQGAVEPAAARD